MRRAAERGFTLLEVVIALSIIGALLTVAYGGLRVGLSAWRQGEDRAEAHQHARGIAMILARAIGAAHPYRLTSAERAEPAVQFEGDPDRVSFVTLSPPFPFEAPIAFTAVVVTLETGEAPGLTVRERALPNRDPFTEATPVFRDPAITTLAFRYLRPGGGWTDRWDAGEERTLPAAVEILLGTTLQERVDLLPPLTVAVRTASP